MEEYKLHMKKMFQTDFCNVSTTSSVQLKMPDCAYKYSIFSVEIRFGLNHFSTISTAKSKKKLVLVASYEKLIQEKKKLGVIFHILFWPEKIRVGHGRIGIHQALQVK